MEESWYWNASADGDAVENSTQGAFYFTQMLTQSLSPRSGSPADANRDGQITLKELYTSLLRNHATSTPQVYPQEDDFVVFTYHPSDETTLDPSIRSPIGDVTFSKSTLSQSDNQLTLEFVANRPVRVAYQIVYRRDDEWRFDEAQLLYDDVERYTAYGDEQGAITPGRKVRTLTLNLQNAGTSGYVLVQVVSIDNGELTVHGNKNFFEDFFAAGRLADILGFYALPQFGNGLFRARRPHIGQDQRVRQPVEKIFVHCLVFGHRVVHHPVQVLAAAEKPVAQFGKKALGHRVPPWFMVSFTGNPSG